jgi:hypothetical protein
MLALYILPVISGSFLRQFPAAAPSTCPGDMSKRVWYACMGQEFRAPTTDELTSGVTVANEMCCTEEIDFECLCCQDFAAMNTLQKCAPGQTGFCLSRCGAVDLDAANEPPGSPLSMEDDATMPAPPGPYAAAAQAPSIVMICTKETGVGAMAAQQSGSTPVQLPMQCIPREFTVGEIQGTQPDLKTGAPLAPGQVILDERIDFLVAQGIPAADVPTCTKTFASKPGGNGMCPADAPKANQYPNSAGDAALGRVGYVVTDEELPAADAAFLKKETNKKRRILGRTFSDLAALSSSEITEVLGEAKSIAFAVANKLVRFQVDEVSTGSSLTLAGEGKKVVVSEKNVVFTDGGETAEVDPQTTVLTTAVHNRMGRRAAPPPMSGGSMMVYSVSNTSGNDF